MQQNEVMIWGAGRYGSAAFHYYQDRLNIVGFIDNDPRKWGAVKDSIKVYSPEILKDRKIDVILAMKRGNNVVKKQLLEQYNIDKFMIFNIEETISEREAADNESIDFDSIILCFTGGLGNQMFEYALLKNLILQGKKVYGDLSAYEAIGQRQFSLLKVFSNIQIEICNNKQKKNFILQNTSKNVKGKKTVFYVEPCIYEVSELYADMSVLEIECGVIRGFHQQYQFSQNIRNVLLEDFAFPPIKEKRLQECKNLIIKDDFVSIHIRRGDYLEGSNEWVFGNICTEEYYNRAISYIKEKVHNCKFVYFSNDIDWVKKHFDIDNAIFVEENMFEKYQDWYDMYLMSICKHNIIANSTFSWWGAWLNKNKNKMVIAPQKWMNGGNFPDICPPDWIRI